MADQQLQELNQATLAGSSLLYVVTDPGGTPTSEKATITSLAGYLDDLAQTLTNKTIENTDNTITIGATALKDYIDNAGRTENAQTGTSYTFVAADARRLTTGNNVAAITHTVPPNASVAYPTGTFLYVAQLGNGQITLAPGSGVTLNSRTTLRAAGQYSLIAAWKYATNSWLVFGDLEP
jgi:hypothetical protein